MKVEDYGPGRIRPHERTHPGPEGGPAASHARDAREPLPHLQPLRRPGQRRLEGRRAVHERRALGRGRPTTRARVHKLWRIDDPEAIDAFKDALKDTELLIADGHHRYETARVYQQEEPSADHVLMCLVALQDSGLTVFPTHRLVTNADRAALATALERDWTTEPRDTLSIGYYADGEERTLYLKDFAIADAALEGKPEPYRRLDTAVLEALILKGALGMSEDDISHFNGLDYARTPEEARAKVDAGAGRRGVLHVPHAGRARPRRRGGGREHAAEVDLLLSQGPDGDGLQSPGGKVALINRASHAASGAMRAIARKREKYTHDVKTGKHVITVDEPEDQGGQDLGPSPQELLAASLASCTAVTMEMYAERKGWNVDGLEVDCRYTPAERGCPTRFELIMRMPAHLSEEQVERLQVIAAKCPVHRTLEGEVAFDERVELS